MAPNSNYVFGTTQDNKMIAHFKVPFFKRKIAGLGVLWPLIFSIESNGYIAQ